MLTSATHTRVLRDLFYGYVACFAMKYFQGLWFCMCEATKNILKPHLVFHEIELLFCRQHTV